jgi:hypothetical protein
VSTEDRIPADHHAEAARDVLASSEKSLHAMLDLQRGTIEALLAIHEQLRKQPNPAARERQADLELINQLPPESLMQPHLLALIEQEIESRIVARTRRTRNVATIVTGSVLLVGATGLAVLAGHVQSLGWVVTFATVLYIIGAICIGTGMRKTRHVGMPPAP